MYNLYIYLAIFRYWNIQRFQMQKNTAKPRCCGGISWLRCISIGRTRDILDLLSLGKSIEKILQRYPV